MQHSNSPCLHFPCTATQTCEKCLFGFRFSPQNKSRQNDIKKKKKQGQNQG